MTILWEAADRICGKRLKEAIPTLLDAMERYGHLQLEAEVRRRLLAMSAATMDRLLKPVREAGKQGRRRSGIKEEFLILELERQAIEVEEKSKAAVGRTAGSQGFGRRQGTAGRTRTDHNPCRSSLPLRIETGRGWRSRGLA